MNKFRSLLLSAFMVLTAACTAFASPDAPTDAEVMAAFKHATTVYEWFEHDPLPTDGKQRFDSGYMIYYSVSDPHINTMLALKHEVHSVFTDALATFIISGNKMYRQSENQLYVAPSAKKADPKKGAASFTISRPSKDKVVVTANVPIYTDKTHTKLVKTQTIEFPYVKTAKGWRFAYYESLK
jgi:hypothetical protein